MTKKEVLAEAGNPADAGQAEETAKKTAVNENQNADSPKPKPSQTTLKDAWKQVETLGHALGTAMQGRGNAVMVRVNDDALRHLDMLVEAEVTRSRSESAAYLINEGIQANPELFKRIKSITDQIIELRSQLRASVAPPEDL